MNPRAKRLVLPIGGAAIATTLIGGMMVSTAEAAPKRKTITLSSAAQAKAVAASWTSSKLKSAKSYLEDNSAAGKLKVAKRASADGKPGAVAPIGAGGGKSAGKSRNVNLPITVGKVFFEVDGKPYWCSGTSIQSKYRNLVATAGHCVYDTDKNKPVDNWVFIPGYHQGKANWGIYVGAKVHAHYDFTVYEDYDYDYAFVNVYNGTKQTGEKEVDFETFKKHMEKGGQGREVEKVVDRETYEKWLQKGGIGKIRDWETSDEVGPSHKDAKPVAVEVDKETFDKAAKLPNGITAEQILRGRKKHKWPAVGTQLYTKTQNVTKTEYEGYKGLGHRKIDDKGNYTITEFYVVKYVKTTKGQDYVIYQHFITTITDAGRLGDNVGGQGFAWNQKAGKNVFVFGYPTAPHLDGNKVYSGQTMKWCYGKTKAAPAVSQYKAEEQQAVKCAFTPGASGGPFLFKYSNAKRVGYLNGVVSLTLDTDGNDRYDHVSTPYFNGETYNIYKHAANLWTGNLPS
jgi:V8-like Glu-specific endopeptidase